MPAVVARVAAASIVLPACLESPKVAVGSDVQLDKRSPLGSRSRGNDAHSDTPSQHSGGTQHNAANGANQR
jgi:hypothetical protein